MKQRSIRLTVSSVIRDLAFLLILLWLVNPQTKFKQYYNWNIYGILLAAWIVFAILADIKAFKESLIADHMLLIWLWPIYLLIAAYFGHAEFSVKQMTTPFIFTFFSYYCVTERKKLLKPCLLASMIYVVIITINTFILNQNNSQVSRILAHGDVDETYGLSSPFLADMRFIYALVALTIVAVGLFKISNVAVGWKIVFIAFWAWTLILYVNVQYVIAIVTVSIISAILLILVEKRYKPFNGRPTVNLKRFLVFSSIMLVLIIVFVNYPSILVFLYDNVAEENIKMKLQEIINATTNSQGAFSLERIQLYSTSIGTFFSGIRNFFFGVGFDADISLIGQHSSLFDTFGRYGLIGGIPWITGIVVAWNHIRKYLSLSFRRIHRLIMTAYVVELVLNPVYSDLIILFFFFLAPTFLDVFSLNKKTESGN